MRVCGTSLARRVWKFLLETHVFLLLVGLVLLGLFCALAAGRSPDPRERDTTPGDLVELFAGLAVTAGMGGWIVFVLSVVADALPGVPTSVLARIRSRPVTFG